jgi:hypothetical protein
MLTTPMGTSPMEMMPSGAMPMAISWGFSPHWAMERQCWVWPAPWLLQGIHWLPMRWAPLQWKCSLAAFAASAWVA